MLYEVRYIPFFTPTPFQMENRFEIDPISKISGIKNIFYH